MRERKMDKQAESEGNNSKKRKLSTYKYLHKTRFIEGRGSDVKIIALNREWNLHKIFLEKSPYFQSMFSGCWTEATQREINIKIEDEYITTEGLYKVFESLYIDEIEIEDAEVIPILACATLFQLDDVIDNCAEVMKAYLNMDTAVSFLEAADRYGMKEVKNISLDYLYRNCCYMFYNTPWRIKHFSSDLMRELLTSPEICVRNESDIFIMLLLWVFLKENSTKDCNSFEELIEKARNYFKSQGNKKAFLDTECGIIYQPLFHTLRLKNLILYHSKIEEIQQYNVIPKAWFNPVFQAQWYHVLRIHEGSDKGPESEKVNEEEFNRQCIRESGFMKKNKFWTRNRFDFGFGLSFEYENGIFCIMRKQTKCSLNDSVGSLSSNSNERNLMYKLTLYNIDGDRKILSKAETGLKTVSLAQNEEIKMLTVKPPMNFPIHYRMNFLFTTPFAADN